MGDFNKNFRSGRGNGGARSGGRSGGFSKRNFGEKNSRDFRDSDKPINFKTVCDDCGRSCTVPFKPSGNKPVYCSDCFENHGNGEDNFKRPTKSFERRNDSNSDLKGQLKEINEKLDVILKSLNK